MMEPEQSVRSMRRAAGRLRERAGLAATRGARGSSLGRGAFTLIEAMIAIGAVALLGVAIAAVFEATGRTTTEGRRLSEFNTKASLIAGQLERDIRQMTRDGFLVIRNERVKIPNGQERRADELLFFASGEFVSSRPPMAPDFQAMAQAARVYYGHGMRRPEDPSTSPNNLYQYPKLNDRMAGVLAFGTAPSAGASNPNLSPSDRVLLRHVTLLSPLANTPKPIAGNPFAPINVPIARLRDNPWQVALQPAATGVFRSFNRGSSANGSGQPFFPDPLPTAATLLRAFDVTDGRAVFSSGLVDIATMGLPEVRQILVTASCYPFENYSNASKVVTQEFFSADTAINGKDDESNAGLDRIYRRATPPNSGTAGTDDEIIVRQQSWMDDAFPAPSNKLVIEDRVRMRCEPEAPYLKGAMEKLIDEPAKRLEHLARLGDQAALAASVIAPRCSEFIVEWSFGERYPSTTTPQEYRGELVWHGMPREVSGVWAALPFADSSAYPVPPGSAQRPQWPAWNPPPANQPDPLVDPLLTFYPTIATQNPPAYHKSDPSLFHRVNELGQLENPTQGRQLSSYFGYMDPSFNPEPGSQAGYKVGVLDAPKDSKVPTLPWAWPKLLRVTMTLVDPSDPAIEQTFQWIFEVPEPGRL